MAPPSRSFTTKTRSKPTLKPALKSSSTSLRSSYSTRSNPNHRPKPDVLPPLTPTRTNFDNGIVTVRYEAASQAKPPIPVTVAPPRQPPLEEHPAFRKDRSAWEEGKGDAAGNLIWEEKERKRDSGLAPTTASSRGFGTDGRGSLRSGLSREGSINTARTREVEREREKEKELPTPEVLSLITDGFNVPKPKVEDKKEKSLPSTPVNRIGTALSEESWRRKSLPKTPKTSDSSTHDFSPITTDIPLESFLGEDFIDQLTFSNRGSVMLGGKKAVNTQARTHGGRRQPSFSMLTQPEKALPDDVQKESQKVRSMYEPSTKFNWEDDHSYVSMMDSLRDQSSSHGLPSPKIKDGLLRPDSAVSDKREHELAGGIEDWEDVDGLDVDRYGFISRKWRDSGGGPEPKPPQRTSTVLQLASETPRRSRGFTRSPSSAASSPFRREPSRKVPAKSLRTENSISTQKSSSKFRAAANRFPGNKDRKWMDEAGDMLTLPPGLADIAENQEGGKAAEALKKREWDRTEKWRKMAKVTKSGIDGQGMEFDFDTKSPKLIERVWKGIPDRWRAAAWYSFLSTSAKKHKDYIPDVEIVAAFHLHLTQSSADDVQIDIDVPRTINSHIMFRRRYRGGQRLLFRVLHALSLYFPDTGYVQGMASLAATLLCYFDEEKTFVMLVRMWTLRGLDKLYEPGFLGLMAALDEFQTQWLHGGEVARQLDDLSIEPTAYGTRWYLTLFNYSIPFPAQLRVWDVFMLLGDSDGSPPTKERPFSGGLDVLHATAAALIDGTREILLDSDFENAMKVLTSWIPVKDEELLMRVARAEWKLNRKKK